MDLSLLLALFLVLLGIFYWKHQITHPNQSKSSDQSNVVAKSEPTKAPEHVQRAIDENDSECDKDSQTLNRVPKDEEEDEETLDEDESEQSEEGEAESPVPPPTISRSKVPPITRIVPSFGLKLDSLPREEDIENTRRLKLLSCDTVCSEILPQLFVGSNKVAMTREILKENGITHIVNAAASECANYHSEDTSLTYLSFSLSDHPGQDIVCVVYDVIQFIDKAVQAGGKVFVHCWQGVSRSTSLVVAYLMFAKGMSYDEAFQYVKERRSVASPNEGFAWQLRDWERRRKGGVSAAILYVFSGLKSHQGETVVPMLIRKFGKKELKSSTCALLHTPSHLFLWIGAQATDANKAKARQHADILTQHEFASKAEEVNEGNESDQFWSFFASEKE